MDATIILLSISCGLSFISFITLIIYIKIINKNFNDVYTKIAKLDKTINVTREVYSSNFNKLSKFVKDTHSLVKPINNNIKDICKKLNPETKTTQKDKTSK